MADIQNPGSALGEAVGAELEKALNAYLTRLLESRGYHFLSKSPVANKYGAQKKLLLYDVFGTAYNIDAVIANESMQPLILIETKYIRYKKHNRDKGSWICTAHPAIRRRYESVRSSIAILAGNWSSTSLTMMKSFNVNIFLIPFSLMCDLLAEYDIDFNWGEKDRKTAKDAWKKYSALTDAQKTKIGIGMVNIIKNGLEKLVLSILDETLERDINRITVELHSNLGEVKIFEFKTVEQAVEFLNTVELKEAFITTDSISLFDPPPVLSDEDE